MLKHFHHETWASFIATARKARHCTQSETRRSQVKRLADEGWVEGASRARKFSASVTEALGALIERIEVNYDVVGHNIDVARFLENEPECWQRFDVEKMQQPARRFIRVVINGSYSGDIDPEVVEQRGAVTVALVELLEYAGNSVEITMARCMTPREAPRDVYLSTTVLKRFDETADMPKIAFALSHPDVLDMYHFSETSTNVNGEYMAGLPMNVPDEFRGDICIDRMRSSESQWSTTRSAVTWVKRKLEEFGVVMHEPAEHSAL
jgi:hypothetical protein